jgi:hypothetical protein
VCVSAGTRNHFAFDLGIDRNDVVAALDAFDDGIERRIDLGRVNGRVFVNNVAMGVYGAVVESPAYRDHKMRTVIDMPPAGRARRRTVRPPFRRARRHHARQRLLILVSNNPYTFDPRPQVPTRGTLDDGMLGVITVARPPPQRPEEWSTPRFRVDSATTVAVGIDGEGVAMSPSLLFESDRQALRVQLPAFRQRRRPRPARTLRGSKDPPTQPSHRS